MIKYVFFRKRIAHSVKRGSAKWTAGIPFPAGTLEFFYHHVINSHDTQPFACHINVGGPFGRIKVAEVKNGLNLTPKPLHRMTLASLMMFLCYGL
jgi:hypothetical protein